LHRQELDQQEQRSTVASKQRPRLIAQWGLRAAIAAGSSFAVSRRRTRISRKWEAGATL
jgi:hypothetical protein